MVIRILPVKRLAPSWSAGMRGWHLALPPLALRPTDSTVALAGTFVLCLGTLAGAMAWRSGTAASPVVASALSSADLGIDATALPVALGIVGAPRTRLAAETIDGGIPAVVASERREGFQEGMVQDLRSGPRALRALAWVYGAPAGAADAYARSARTLSSPLPDASLRSRMEPVDGLGRAALLATYDSIGVGQRYTVSTVVAYTGRVVVQVQAFPSGRANGYPARDRAGLLAVARLLLARAAANGG